MKKLLIKTVLASLILILAASSFVSASEQDYRYRKSFKVQRLSLAQGLSQSVVQDVIQDQRGFIWLATEDGLNRFDSYQFKIYRHDLLNSKSLHENWVISLFEEPGVGIWVGTVAGVSLFDPKNEEFTDYSIANPKLKTKIHGFISDSQRRIWVASDKGLYTVDHASKKILPFQSASGDTIVDKVISLTKTNESLFVATENCIYKIHQLDLRLENLCKGNPGLETLEGLINVVRASENELWVGTTDGLILLDIEGNRKLEYRKNKKIEDSIADNYIQDLLVQQGVGVWVATTGGLDFYNVDENTFRHYQQQTISQEGLSSNDVVSIFVDRENLMWAGTYGGGVNILDPNQHQFEHLLSKSDVAEIGGNNTIHGIEKDPFQNLWLASYGGGLINYDLLTGKVSRPLFDRGFEKDKYVYAVKIDASLRLWVASLLDLTLVNLKTKAPIQTNFVVDGIKMDSIPGVKRIYEDHRGSIWLGTIDGLLKVTDTNPNSSSSSEQILTVMLKDYTTKLPNSFTSSNPTISSIVEDKSGNFWFGGLAGLVYYRPVDDAWIHYRFDRNNPQSLTNDNVQVIYEDSHGFVWIGTADGLNRVVQSDSLPTNYFFERITTHQGLPNNSVYGILEDDKQQLWISTNLGIVRYRNNVSKSDSFRSSDGLSSDEFNTGAYFSDSEGRLYFGSINGITIINKSENKQQHSVHPVIFTKLKVGDRNLNLYELNADVNPTITLRKHELSLDVAVANISFSKLKTQRYRYRILPIDDEWQYLETHRNIFVTGLSAGHYVLEIQSQTSSQDWGEKTKILSVNVVTDFWQSTTGYYLIFILIISLFISSLWVISRYYSRVVSRLNRRYEVENLRLREIRLDNESLKTKLESNEEEMSILQKDLEYREKLLSANRYKDLATGFFRVNYLTELISKRKDRIEGSETQERSVYKGTSTIRLVDYNKIEGELGSFAASQLVHQVADTLRRNIDSQIEIFVVSDGVFFLASSGLTYKLFESNVNSICNQIERSVFDVTSGITRSTLVSRVIANVSDLDLTNRSNFNNLIALFKKIQEQFKGDFGDDSVNFYLNNELLYEVTNDVDFDLSKFKEKFSLDFRKP